MATSPLDSCYDTDPRVVSLFLAIDAAGKEVKDLTHESVEIPGPPYDYMQSYFVTEVQEILRSEGWKRQGHHGSEQWSWVKEFPGMDDLEVTIDGAEDSEERFTLTFFLVE